jgi:hypothetical protein
MPRQSSFIPGARPTRSGVDRVPLARVLWVCLLAPLLVLGSFGGTSFFAHAHDGHGLHVHAALTEAEATRLAALHIHHHEIGLAHDHDHECTLGHDTTCEHAAANEPAHPAHGVLVSLPEHDQLRAQAAEVPHFPTLIGELVVFGWCTLPVPTQAEAAPVCEDRARPKHLSGLRSCARIVRTNRALLI